MGESDVSEAMVHPLRRLRVLTERKMMRSIRRAIATSGCFLVKRGMSEEGWCVDVRETALDLRKHLIFSSWMCYILSHYQENLK